MLFCIRWFICEFMSLVLLIVIVIGNNFLFLVFIDFIVNKYKFVVIISFLVKSLLLLYSIINKFYC